MDEVVGFFALNRSWASKSFFFCNSSVFLTTSATERGFYGFEGTTGFEGAGATSSPN